MEEQDNKDNLPQGMKNGRIMSGMILIGVGCVFMARQLGVPFPDWLFTWPTFLIVLGFYVGAKHNFRNPGWIIMVGIGLIFLLEQALPDLEISRFGWPLIFILAGLVMVFKPYRKKNYSHWVRNGGLNERGNMGSCGPVIESSEDFLNSTTIMGGVKKNVISKQFRGGNIECIMGGAEINLSQSDIQETATLEVTVVMGGAKLIVPANWEIRSEAVVILGGIEDKRKQIIDRTSLPTKTLIIKGSCIFGGIDIKSY